ncbi:hypothetical protein [Corticimicrobacter populi]|uniref:Uncharacterized protein n=1 Tax=Corticimicrobacter populi TaxID=2175229 RepID=A0A2V1K4A5_9BURK|nr:hypothetical protein [Corticimicrobacter populi]PWF25073.1 hypothetical protein DD235_02580 [Corticimicrobacter populi]
MGIFDLLKNLSDAIGSNNRRDNSTGLIDYGKQKTNGGHDHRYNTGDDRTPAQKQGDQNKKKS